MYATEGPSLNARFSIKQLPDVERKPFYIYEYKVVNSKNILVGESTRTKVINKVMNRVIEEQEPSSSLYSRSKSQLYTQFPISDDTLSGIYQKVSPNSPEGWKVDLVSGETCVNLTLKLLCGPIVDLDCCNLSHDEEKNIGRSILALISADYYGEDYFDRNNPHPYYYFGYFEIMEIIEINQDVRQRATSLGPMIRHDWGLSVSVVRAPSGSNHKYQLECTDIDNFFLESINLVDFLQKQFSIHKWSTPGDIKEKMESLVGVEVVVKLKKEGSEDYVTVSDKIYKIRSVCARSMETHFFLQSVSGEEDKLAELMSVEQLFEKEFPGQDLQHKYLPCLVVDGDKYLPMELCWIKPVKLRGDERVLNLKQLGCATWPTIAERHKIFLDNCNSLCSRSTTLKKFGFLLELASDYQSCTF